MASPLLVPGCRSEAGADHGRAGAWCCPMRSSLAAPYGQSLAPRKRELVRASRRAIDSFVSAEV
jgi:hypothetical protein